MVIVNDTQSKVNLVNLANLFGEIEFRLNSNESVWKGLTFINIYILSTGYERKHGKPRNLGIMMVYVYLLKLFQFEQSRALLSSVVINYFHIESFASFGNKRANTSHSCVDKTIITVLFIMFIILVYYSVLNIMMQNNIHQRYIINLHAMHWKCHTVDRLRLTLTS